MLYGSVEIPNMALKSTYQIDISPLIDYTNSIPQRKESGLKAAIEALFKEADSRVPELTGALRRSGKTEVSEDEASLTYGESDEFDDERAVAREFGTVFQRATPYITPALQNVNITAIMAEHILK